MSAKAARQPATGRCDCGAVVTFTPHVGRPYEFDWRCARTPHPHRGVVSWAHRHPPPVFEGPPAPVAAPVAAAQLDLFADQTFQPPHP